MRLPLAVFLAWVPLPALAAKRIAVVVGNNRADDSRPHLLYAERDARQMSRVLESIGGVERSYLLIDRAAADLEETLRSIRTELAAGGGPTTVLFFYSGHGDDRALLMRGSRFEFSALRKALESLPTALFVAFIDACQAGGIARLKGGTAVPVVDVDLYGGSGPTNGGIFITSGAPGENAQESDELEASFFTHYLLSGLRGAADDSGDRRVSLDEAYRFAYRHTLERTRGTLLGPQHPTYDVDVEGRGQLVLTWLSERSSYLVLPEGSQGTYFFRAEEDDELVAEVNKRPDERMRISVEPGRYEVAKAEGGFLLSQVVSIGANRELALEDSRMGARPLVLSGSKGGPTASTSGLLLTYRLRSGYLRDAGLAHGLGLAYLLDVGPLQLGPLLSWSYSRYARSDGIEVTASDLEAGARIGAAWAIASRVSLFAGLELGIAWTSQRGSRAGDSDLISAVTFPERVVAGIEVELFAPVALVVLGHGGVVAFDGLDGPTAHLTFGAGAGFEVRL